MPSVQKTKLTVRQQRVPFGGTCLPLTMELARLTRHALLPAMDAIPVTWCYEDRVLVLLAPSLREDVEHFYDGTASSMTDTFEPHQVEHLDRSFIAQLLTLVARLSPAMAAGIAAASSISVLGPGSSNTKS